MIHDGVDKPHVYPDVLAMWAGEVRQAKAESEGHTYEDDGLGFCDYCGWREWLHA